MLSKVFGLLKGLSFAHERRVIKYSVTARPRGPWLGTVVDGPKGEITENVVGDKYYLAMQIMALQTMALWRLFGYGDATTCELRDM